MSDFDTLTWVALAVGVWFLLGAVRLFPLSEDLEWRIESLSRGSPLHQRLYRLGCWVCWPWPHRSLLWTHWLLEILRLP